jgi:signal-transduction protein with cAMP-binding, CBS, and nucleotidyltransferase domain
MIRTLSKQITRTGLSIRAQSTNLKFKPVLDPPTDPIEETARSAFEKSCYLLINWKISENAPVSEAVNRMCAHQIGVLAVTEGDGEDGDVVGVISERDYLNKIAFLKRPKDTKVREVCTYGKANLISVTLDNPIDACMRKMIDSNLRHLLIRQKQTGNIVGVISIKDIVKCAVAKHDAVVSRLSGMVDES